MHSNEFYSNNQQTEESSSTVCRLLVSPNTNPKSKQLNPLAKSFRVENKVHNNVPLMIDENIPTLNLFASSFCPTNIPSKINFTIFCYILICSILTLCFYFFFIDEINNILLYTSSVPVSPISMLQNIRLRNLDRIIFGHLNINSIRNKINILESIATKNIDILLISETKIDESFSNAQFRMNGFSEPIRIDRNSNGGGLLLYTRKDIVRKQLPLIAAGIECLFIEITIAKNKWLLIGFYNPDKSQITKNIDIVETNLFHYLSHYDNIILLGDFNCSVSETSMSTFCNTFCLKSLIKVPTCYKSTENPTCIDLILTNRPRSFLNSTALEVGLSDFHLLTLTVLKTSFKRKPPRIVKYREYKKYSFHAFQTDMYYQLGNVDFRCLSNDDFHTFFMRLVDLHVPLKTKYIRGNDQPFMNKQLRKEHMKRTMLKNKYLKNRSSLNWEAFKIQRNYCIKLLRETKKSYFGCLKPSDISDNKKFWKTTKPFFSDKMISSDSITLVEECNIITDPSEIAENFGRFFNNAVKNLNIKMHSKTFNNECLANINPITEAIKKYENHPSIMKIKEHFSENFNFSFKSVSNEEIQKEIRDLSETKSSPLDAIPARIIKDHEELFC